MDAAWNAVSGFVSAHPWWTLVIGLLVGSWIVAIAVAVVSVHRKPEGQMETSYWLRPASRYVLLAGALVVVAGTVITFFGGFLPASVVVATGPVIGILVVFAVGKRHVEIEPPSYELSQRFEDLSTNGRAVALDLVWRVQVKGDIVTYLPGPPNPKILKILFPAGGVALAMGATWLLFDDLETVSGILWFQAAWVVFLGLLPVWTGIALRMEWSGYCSVLKFQRHHARLQHMGQLGADWLERRFDAWCDAAAELAFTAARSRFAASDANCFVLWELIESVERLAPFDPFTPPDHWREEMPDFAESLWRVVEARRPSLLSLGLPPRRLRSISLVVGPFLGIRRALLLDVVATSYRDAAGDVGVSTSDGELLEKEFYFKDIISVEYEQAEGAEEGFFRLRFADGQMFGFKTLETGTQTALEAIRERTRSAKATDARSTTGS